MIEQHEREAPRLILEAAREILRLTIRVFDGTDRYDPGSAALGYDLNVGGTYLPVEHENLTIHCAKLSLVGALFAASLEVSKTRGGEIARRALLQVEGRLCEQLDLDATRGCFRVLQSWGRANDRDSAVWRLRQVASKMG